MIKKDIYTEGGVQLYRTYSDTDHKIRNIEGNTYDEAIDVSDDVYYEEVNDYVDLLGPESYEEIVNLTEKTSAVTRKINRIPLTDNEALSVKELYPRWEDKINSTIEVGFITLYDGNLWKARQTHAALEVYPPSLNTASLYEVIVEEHEGTKDDPISYTPPMEIFEGKYYMQYDVLYKCTRDSGTALSHDLSALVGLYVELAEKE